MNGVSSVQESSADPQFASTLANGIDVLSCFRHGETALGNKDFSERTGLSPSTVFRLTYTLVQLGYLRKLPGESKYRPGPALLTTVYPLLASMQLRQVARSLMRELAERIHGAVSLVVKDQCRMLHVETSRANEAMVTHPDIGSSMPMLNTAAGKTWLCQASAAEREKTLNELRVRMPVEYEAYFPGLKSAFSEFEKTGCCSSRGQWKKSVYGFSTPFVHAGDSMVYIINCGVPSGSGSFDARKKEIFPMLRELVRRIDAILEY